MTPSGSASWTPLPQQQQQQQQPMQQFAQYTVPGKQSPSPQEQAAVAAYGIGPQAFQQGSYQTPQTYSPPFAYQPQAAATAYYPQATQLLQQQQQQLYSRGYNHQQIYSQYGMGAFYPQANFGYSMPTQPYAPYPMAGGTVGGGGSVGGGNSKNRVPGGSCFIFHLPPSATDETLKQLFSEHGTVLNAYVAMDKQTNRSKGYGFVDFGSPEEANAAVLAMDKRPCGNKFLAVSIKK